MSEKKKFQFTVEIKDPSTQDAQELYDRLIVLRVRSQETEDMDKLLNIQLEVHLIA